MVVASLKSNGISVGITLETFLDAICYKQIIIYKLSPIYFPLSEKEKKKIIENYIYFNY